MDLATLGGLARLRFPQMRNLWVRPQPPEAGVYQASFLAPSGLVHTGAGTTQATAAPILTNIALFTTVAASTGGILPPTTGPNNINQPVNPTSNEITVLNQGANPLAIYPPVGSAIDGLGTNNPITLPVGGNITFFTAGIAGQYYSDVGELNDGISGTFTANGATSVTVTNAKITANSTVEFGLKTVGGTILGAPYMFTVTPGTGFTVRAGASDTSVYNYTIIN